MNDSRSPMTATDAIASRRSIRSYKSDPVDDATIQTLVHLAVQAPTAMHGEPWVFVIVQDRDALKRYSDVAKTALRKEAALYQDLHYPSLKSRNGDFLKALERPDFNIFYNAGTLILICAHLTNPFVAADCWLAAENIMIAAAGMSLGSCCIGSALPAVNSPAVKTELGMPAGLSAVAAIIVGVPDERLPPSGRQVPTILTWKRATRSAPK
jgi:nitroreductase